MKTLKKWNKKGYFVNPGETHMKRSKKGKPLFSKKQVTKCSRYTNFDHYTQNNSKYYFENPLFEDTTPYDLGFDW